MFKYYPTEDMIADVLTKPLVKDRHQALTNAMGACLKQDKNQRKNSMRLSHSKHSSYAFVYACAMLSLVLLLSNRWQ